MSLRFSSLYQRHFVEEHLYLVKKHPHLVEEQHHFDEEGSFRNTYG